MSATIAGLLIVFGGLLGVLLVRVHLILTLLRNRDVDHAKCIAHVSHYVGNQFAAQVLLAAAEDYTSPEGQYELEVLVNSQTSDLEPIPALWLRQRAVGFQHRTEP